MEKDNRQKISRAAIALGALMFSTYIGPGFTAGTQTVTYFLTKGWVGVIIAHLVLILPTFVWFYLCFEFNRAYRPKDYREQFDRIFAGDKSKRFFGTIKDLFTGIQMIIVMATIISGAATILYDQFGIPDIPATICFALLLIILTIKGRGSVTKLGSIIAIFILVFILFITISGFGKSWPLTAAFLAAKTTPQDYGYSTFYAWYLMMSAMIFFTSGMNSAVPVCLNALKSKRDSFAAALIPAVLCPMSTMVCAILFASGMPGIMDEPIPMLFMLKSILGAGSLPQIIYVAIAMAAMINSGVSLLFGFSERYQYLLGKVAFSDRSPGFRRGLVGVVTAAVAAGFSRFGILTIIKSGFTTFTLVAAPLIVYVLFFAIPYRIISDKRAGTYPGKD